MALNRPTTKREANVAAKKSQADTREQPQKRTPKQLSEKREALAKRASELERDAKTAVQSQAPHSEQSFQREYARMLRYNSRLIQRMNQQLEGTLVARDIYALSTLMSQQREVINDLRAIADLSQQVTLIHDTSINPFMSDLTQLITDIYYQIRKLVAETVRPSAAEFANKQLDDLIKQLGLGVQASNAKLRQSISDILAGPPVKETVKRTKSKR